MRLEYQILIALGLDLLLGDPQRLPHPVRFIGRFALAVEGPLRRSIRPLRVAGGLAAVLVIAVTTALAWGALRGAEILHPRAGEIASVVILYWSFAVRDLEKHAMEVYQALAAGNIAAARQLVSLIVGRDTAAMDEKEVARAAVESVAENTVDGIVARLFFAVLAGPAGAMCYKAVSTLDSTFGYRNERYREFGWASARLDDVANYLPARLTAPLMMVAALFRGGMIRAFHVCRRDGRLHASPNSGLAEAAMAGALGIRLGGPVRREGVRKDMPFLGAPAEPPQTRHIRLACVLMLITACLAAGVLIAARFGITALIG